MFNSEDDYKSKTTRLFAKSLQFNLHQKNKL